MLLKVHAVLVFLVIGAYASNSSSENLIIGLKNPEVEKSTMDWRSVKKEFQRFVDSFLTKNLRKIYQMSETMNISSRCRGSMMETVMAFRNMKEWAVRCEYLHAYVY
ncbi:hypothetical protein AVEN_105191-1 [Araneus ventricosus]|uniref:Cathepsin propeptide inhibitor domain-containing protein n=1 Tax=Araneus ventricosus TaxID=182803 RepID=A0A4Y2MAR8_ARAVE|nr:hypothetical protein AVEN_105191-1 [Araneus ventricosus]